MYNNKISVKKYTPKNVQFFIVFLCPIQSVSIEKGHNPRMKKKKMSRVFKGFDTKFEYLRFYIRQQ